MRDELTSTIRLLLSAPLLDVIDPAHCLGVGGITSQTPYRVGGIEYDAPVTQYLQGIFYIVTEFASSYHHIIFPQCIVQ